MGRYKQVEVEIDLEDFSDDELIEELEVRKVYYHRGHVTCEQLLDAWLLYPDKFQDLFRTYCRENIGKSFS
jgi:hypothetical protein